MRPFLFATVPDDLIGRGALDGLIDSFRFVAGGAAAGAPALLGAPSSSSSANWTSSLWPLIVQPQQVALQNRPVGLGGRLQARFNRIGRW